MNKEILNKHKLNEIEYVYLLSLIDKSVDFEIDFNKLHTLGYLIDEQTISDKGRGIFVNTDDEIYNEFCEIYELYPLIANHGSCRAKSPDSSDGKYCLSKFRYYRRKDPLIKDKIIKGLNIELQIKRKDKFSDADCYFSKIKKWFNNQEWEQYTHLEYVVEPTKQIDENRII